MLNVVIIGCGAVSEELHAPALRQIARTNPVRVTALIDPDARRTEKLRKWFPQATEHRSCSGAYTAPGTTVTLVASPPGFHRQHVEAALAAGSHILCEKPLATSVSDTAALAAQATAADRKLAVGMTRRFFPSLATAARWIERGALGWPLSFTCLEGSVYAWPITSDAPFRRSIGGGGVLLDKGVHVLDSLLWLFGTLQLESSADDALENGVEGNCRLRLAGARVTGTLQLSWDQQLVSGLHIRGPLGEMRVDPDQFRYVGVKHPGQGWERTPTELACLGSLAPAEQATVTPTNYEDCIRLQWIAFLRAVLFNEPVPVGAPAALAVAGQIEAAYQGVTPLLQPWLTEREATELTRWHWRTAAA